MKTSDRAVVNDRVSKLNAAGFTAAIRHADGNIHARITSDKIDVRYSSKLNQNDVEYHLNTLSAELSCVAKQSTSNTGGTPPKNPNEYVTTDDIIDALVEKGFDFRRSAERELKGEPAYVIGCWVRIRLSAGVSHEFVTVHVPREKHTMDWLPTLVDHAVRLVAREGIPARTSEYRARHQPEPPESPEPPKGRIEHRVDAAVLEDVTPTLEHTTDITWQSTLSVIFQGVIAIMLVLFMFLGVPA